MNHDNRKDSSEFDPLGLKRLQEAVTALSALHRETQTDQPDRKSLAVERVEQSLQDVSNRYDMLKDRYALLKRSNAALCDELEWLRDQLDDLCAETSPDASGQ